MTGITCPERVGTIAGVLEGVLWKLKESDDLYTQTVLASALNVLKKKGIDPEDLLGNKGRYE